MSLVVIMLVLTAGCDINNPFVDAQQVERHLDQLKAAVKAEDWEAAAEEAAAVRSQWEAAEPWLTVHNDRRDIQRFTTGLGRMEIFLERRQAEPILLELLVVRQTWHTLVNL